LATTAQRAFTAGPTPAPRARQAPRPAPTVRVVPLALIPSLPHQLVPISFGEFSPLDDPKKTERKDWKFSCFFLV